MANQNPIRVNADSVRTFFEIDPKFKDETLKITIEFSMGEKDWVYGGIHDILLESDYIFSSDSQEPKAQPIDKISDLNGLNLRLESQMFLIHSKGGVKQAAILYMKIHFYAGDTLLETFEAQSTGSYNTYFNSWLKIKI